MQLTTLLTFVALSSAANAATISEARAPQPCFPKDIQAGVLNIQNQINTVINDIVQGNTKSVANDYSSTGRSLAFLERGIRPKGCPTVPLPMIPQTADANIANLQKTQLTLSYVAQDAINSQCQKGKQDICSAKYLYEEVAQYVNTIRTN